MIELENENFLKDLEVQLDYIHDTLDLVVDELDSMKEAYNNTSIIVNTLVDILIKNELIQSNEFKEMGLSIKKNLEKEEKNKQEQLKKDDKQIFYDRLLNSDFGGRA